MAARKTTDLTAVTAPTANTIENWRKIRDHMERAGKTENHYYRRALAILAGRPDPFDRYDGSVGLEAPEGNVIPYADLTPEIVIGWTQSKLGGDEKVAEIQAALQKQLDEQRAPSVAQGLPWSN